MTRDELRRRAGEVFGWALTWPAKLAAILALALLLIWGAGKLAGWMAGPPADAGKASDPAVEQQKADLAAGEAEDLKQAGDQRAEADAARARADNTRRRRKVTREEDRKTVDDVRGAPDDEQPRLYRPTLDRARAALDELDAHDRERARARARERDAHSGRGSSPE